MQTNNSNDRWNETEDKISGNVLVYKPEVNEENENRNQKKCKQAYSAY